jgi:hypothetical protein
MTAHDTAFIRRQLTAASLSQRAAAKRLEIDERTMRRSCSGELPVPTKVSMALNWLGIIRGNEKVIEFVNEHGAKLVYELQDRSSDITEQETGRLRSINKKLKSEIHRVSRAK